MAPPKIPLRSSSRLRALSKTTVNSNAHGSVAKAGKRNALKKKHPNHHRITNKNSKKDVDVKLKKMSAPPKSKRKNIKNVIPALDTLSHPSAKACAMCSERTNIGDKLYSTISNNHVECFDAILDRATASGTRRAPTLMNQHTMWGTPALVYACSYNRMHFVKALVAAGADVCPSSANPLDWSCGNVGPAKFLLQCGGSPFSNSNCSHEWKAVLERAAGERSRGKTYAAWADLIESAAQSELDHATANTSN